MFTGIITNKTKVKSKKIKNKSLYLDIVKPPKWRISLGESIATNGVCLTVKEIYGKYYTVELMLETLSKTTFGKTLPEDLNLERSLTLSSKISGHFVTGHIDTIGKIIKIEKQGSAKKFFVLYPKKFKKLLIPKGSIAIDGVSLTVVDVSAKYFSVAILDYTLRHTNLGDKKLNELVNLEFDILAKYINNQ